MPAARRFRGIVAVALFLLTIVSIATAKYSGGSGTAQDPYQIATAADLILLGETPADYGYGKHIIMTADIDLDPNLPGRKVFDKAVIAGSSGAWFTGVFDGNGHTISHLTIRGKHYVGLFGQLGGGARVSDLGVVDVNVTGSWYVGGLVGMNSGALIHCCYSTGAVRGAEAVGGLVGDNTYGAVTQCYSTCAISGQLNVGGLVGWNGNSSEETAVVAKCYSTGVVTGTGSGVGGLVGYNGYYGAVTQCYSTGAVSGQSNVGGLVGSNYVGSVTYSFWDTQTSGQAKSAGGVGLTTAEMKDPDMLGLNGLANDPNWVLDADHDYPRLAWEGTAGQIIPAPDVHWLEGRGTAENPYRVDTADQLILLGKASILCDQHFRLVADIDLSAKKWSGPAIPWFAGQFDGNGHAISHLTIQGESCLGLFGRLESGAEVKDLRVVDVNIVGSGSIVGGLVGANGLPGRGHEGGALIHCCSTGRVSGGGQVGGLVGGNAGAVTQCYSTAAVSGNAEVGGLVGLSWGTVTQCYSTGAVSGKDHIGGLVGENYATVTHCYTTGAVSGTGKNIGGLVGAGLAANTSFWDIQSSGQTKSAGGTGKTTAEMQTAETFLDAGWDFVGETQNGAQDVWWILEDKTYPQLWWDFSWACRPNPRDDAIDVVLSAILAWHGATRAVGHDVYFGEDGDVVANATRESLGIYRGQQPKDINTYDPGIPEWGRTYYWRIDEVKDGDPNSPWKGSVWSFTMVDFIVVSVVDDFESYTDKWPSGPVLLLTWKGRSFNGTMASVGPSAEQTVIHGDKQSMPMTYTNLFRPWYSEAERTWDTPQNWTVDGADTLTLYFRGKADNGREPLYVVIEDSAGRIAVAVHPDAAAVLATEWQKWRIVLTDMRAAGVDVAAVKKMVIGVGDRQNPKPGGTGRIYIDDIRLTKRMP
jgi:hypothetical protein